MLILNRLAGFGAHRWTPLDLRPVVWLDFADPSSLWQDTSGTTAVAAASDTIARANNKGTAHGYFSQATGTKQPSWQTTDYPHASFDGGDVLASSAAIDLAATDELTTLVSIQRATTSVTATIVYEHSSDVNSNTGTFYNSATDGNTSTADTRESLARGTATVVPGILSSKSGLATSGSAEVIVSTHDISTSISTIRVNASAGTNGTASKGSGNFSSQTQYVGGRGTTPSLAHNGRIVDVMLFDRILTAAEIARLETYVGAKMGVTL